MKIQSRFKDYYDYVAHIYGGGDPKITYVREPLTEFNQYGFRPDLLVKHNVEYRLPDTPSYYSRFKDYSFAVLVIMNRPFLLYSRKLEVGYSAFALYDFILNPLDLNEKRYAWSDTTTDYPRGDESQNILELTKKVGAPVYLINSSSYYQSQVYIQPEIPNLGKLGVASFYPAEQLYQDLAYFIGNTMKDSPDTKPPVEVSDLDRLQQYGFDRKVSFRHRK